LLEKFISLNVVSQAFIAGVFTWAMTALGAAFVFLFKKISPKVSAIMLGCAAGIMLAASFWSLLMPSIDMAASAGMIAWVPAVVGFLLGGLFLRLMDYVVPHLHIGAPTSEREGPRTKMKRSSLMIFAVTLHNFPEGLACGVAFGALATGGAESIGLMGAITLTLGIGLQNIPEGFAVSAPLLSEGFSRKKSFFYGQLSGTVEIVGAVLGAVIAASMTRFLPYALSFAAGAMIYVVVEEIIPESQRSKYGDIATIATMVGFAIMMILDVALS
jgi:ZIP family zinc transporter